MHLRMEAEMNALLEQDDKVRTGAITEEALLD